MRKILTRNQFLDTVRTQSYTKYTGIGKTNEAFANDVNWGDSWVGILISSLNRKIKTKRNLKKMDGVIKLIKEKFDELVDLCKIEVEEITEAVTITAYYLNELEISIINKVAVSEIIIICNRLITFINDSDIFTDKDYLLNPTNNFLNFLKTIKVSDSDDSDVASDVASDDESEESTVNPEDDKLIQEILALDVAKKNPLQLNPYVEKVKKSIQIVENRLKSPSKVKSDIDETELNKVRNEILKIILPDKQPSRKREGLALFPEEKSTDFKVKADEFKKNNDLEKLKNLLIQVKLIIKQIEIYNKLNEGDKKGIESEFNKKVDSIYKELIKKWQEEQKKAGQNTVPGEGTRKRFRKKAEEMAKNKELVSSNESKISNYLDFIIEKDLIPYNKSEIVKSEEADKSDDSSDKSGKGEKNKTEKTDIYVEIDAKFNEFFTDNIRSKFLVDKETGEYIKKQGKVTESFTLTNENQIIELVRLFMRAYRIHTPGRIPSGRTDGRVAGRVFDQYEYVGSGEGGTPDKPGSGPYRNIEIYQKFETAMFDIMADTKYTSTIFSDDAKFYFSKDKKSPVKLSEVTVEKLGARGSAPEDYMKAAKPLGKILLRFMRNMIDNPQMYREGSIGKFLNEYFGIGGDMKESELQFKGFDDVDKNAETTGNQRDKIRAKFVKVFEQEEYKSIKEKVKKEKDNKFLLKLKFKGENKNTYLLYLGFFKNNYYFFKTQSNEILDKNGSSIDIEKLPFEKLNTIYIIETDGIDELKLRGNFKFKQSGNLKDKDSIDNFKFEDHQIQGNNPFIEDEVEILVEFKDENPLSDITYGKQYSSIFEKKVRKK